MRATLGLLVCLVGGLAFAARASSAATFEVTAASAAGLAVAPATKEALGALVFADTTLSEPIGQACASCHDAAHGFADPRGTATSEGVVTGRFGVRNAPSITYASLGPALGPSGDEGAYGGGLFWDGRAGTLEDQARGPLLNPLEMGDPDALTIVRKLRKTPYADAFLTLYGTDALDAPDAALDHLADALAAFERAIPGRFTSRYDAFLAGKPTLSPAETRGLALFEDRRTGPCTPPDDAPPCGCAQCHLDRPGEDGSAPLFTDFGFDNLGIPGTRPGFVDDGLATILHEPRQRGHFKAPTLRNIALTAPYGHNGYFADLKDVVHFYNTRDVPGAWPAPEQRAEMNATALGDLGLSDQDENDLVAFLGTLTDGYHVR